MDAAEQIVGKMDRRRGGSWKGGSLDEVTMMLLAHYSIIVPLA